MKIQALRPPGPGVPADGASARKTGEVITLMEVQEGETVIFEGDSYLALGVTPGEYLNARVYRMRLVMGPAAGED